MAEYIDREALIAEFKRLKLGENSFIERVFADGVYAIIEQFPAADVAPVVRCKDCKHYRNHPNGLCYLHTEPKENARGHSGNAVCVEPDDFCSYGERKEGIDNG